MIEMLRPRELRARGMLGMNARNLDFIGRYNPRSRFPLVDNKLRTKLIAEQYGVPVPRLRFAVDQQHQVNDALRKLAELDGFAIKPAKGSGA